MNKGTVSSEELKRQLAESLPGAIQVFAKAMGITEQELFKQMELGKVYAKDVLPLVAKEMRNVANSGGALEEKYKTTRVAQGKFFNQLELAQNKVFKSGFDKGLAGLFNNLSDVFKDNQGVLEDLGDTFGLVFKAITKVISFLTPIVSAFIRTLNSLGNTIRWLVDNPIAGLTVGLGAVSFAIKGLIAQKGLIAAFGTVLSRAFAAPFTIIMGIVAALDEIRAFFDADVVGIFDSMDDSYQKAQYDAAMRRRMFGMSKKGDEGIISRYESSGLTLPQQKSQAVRDQILGRELSVEKQNLIKQREMEILSAQASGGFLDRMSLRISALTGNEQARSVLSGNQPSIANQTVTINVTGAGDPAKVATEVHDRLTSVFVPAYGGR